MKVCDSRYNKCLYFTVSALSRKVEKLATQCWKPTGLSPSHGYLLMIVLDEPGVQPSFLVEQLQLTPSTITRLVEKLEEKKLVQRIAAGKVTNIYPTPKGKAMLPELKVAVAELYGKYSSMLGNDTSKQMIDSICTLADKMSD